MKVATTDLGDCHLGGPIRLLTGDNTPALGKDLVSLHRSLPDWNKSISCKLSQDAFHLVDLVKSEHVIAIHNIVVETVE